ncbi:MAG: GIY-YIG nuclease family protein [Terriglobia bacterium]
MEELRRDGWLELYQAYQSKSLFHDVKQIVSFYGLSGSRAGFYGVYKVLGHHPKREGLTPNECELSRQWNRGPGFFYDLERDRRFDDLRDRLIIDWPGPRGWYQKRLDNKYVLEILESGRKLPPFSDYLEFSLTYAQLKDLFENEEAHRDWRIQLSAVAGVYLVLAQTSGQQYVGSAYGPNGIWGRWREYATSGHGGNDHLRHLVRKNASYPEHFRFSVLQILPKTMARKSVIQCESLYKQKLGSRAMGLNS